MIFNKKISENVGVRAKIFFFEMWIKLGIAGKNICGKIFFVMKQKILEELGFWARGLIASIVAGAAIGALQYIGAHIPDCITWITTTAAAVAGIKTGH